MKYYWAVEDGAARFSDLVADRAAGPTCWNTGCGLGTHGGELAPVVRSFHAIDISEAAIRQVSATVAAPNVRFEVMDAMKLEYPANSFDLVYGSGIVHHLDTEVSAREVARVLRVGGTALFWEPLGYNPVINAYRAMTPGARTVDEHPLLAGDLAQMRRHFAAVEPTFFGLTSIAAVPLRAEPDRDAGACCPNAPRSRAVPGARAANDGLVRTHPLHPLEERRYALCRSIGGSHCGTAVRQHRHAGAQ